MSTRHSVNWIEVQYLDFSDVRVMARRIMPNAYNLPHPHPPPHSMSLDCLWYYSAVLAGTPGQYKCFIALFHSCLTSEMVCDWWSTFSIDGWVSTEYWLAVQLHYHGMNLKYQLQRYVNQNINSEFPSWPDTLIASCWRIEALQSTLEITFNILT